MSESEQKARYIEEVGTALEALGIPWTLGRAVGALLLADPPELSADGLAAALRASPGTISTSTRTLEEMGIVERVRKAGDRKQYFRLRLGAWQEIVRKRAEAFKAAGGVAEKGLVILGGDRPDVGQGLREMLEFMRFVVKEQTTLLESWEREHPGQYAA